MSPLEQLAAQITARFPRVSGDEPRSPRASRVTVRFSLRERG